MKAKQVIYDGVTYWKPLFKGEPVTAMIYRTEAEAIEAADRYEINQRRKFEKALERLGFDFMPKCYTGKKPWIVALEKRACTWEQPKSILLVNKKTFQIVQVMRDAGTLKDLFDALASSDIDKQSDRWKGLFKPGLLEQAKEILKELPTC